MEYRQYSPTPGPQWHAAWSGGHVEPNRKIYDYELVFFSAGTGRVIVGDAVFECVPGSLIVIPPGVVHCTIAVTAVERWCVHFDWFGDCPAHWSGQRIFLYSGEGDYDESLSAAPPDLEGVLFPCFRRRAPSGLLPLLRAYFPVVPRDAATRMIKHGLLQQLLGLALRSDSKTEVGHPEAVNVLLFKAKNRIDTEYAKSDLSVGRVAADLNVSVNHLTRVFRSTLGMSVCDYLLSRRLEHGCMLLRRHNLTVREVAFASGFNDPNYFSRFFRKRTGQSPKNFHS